MNVYFIRHGETIDNRQHRHQPDTEPLTELGRQQAAAAAEVIAAKAPTHLITSTFTRAEETAKAIEEKLGMRAERSDKFVELRRPAHIVGYHHFSPKSVFYVLRWFFSHNEAYWERVGGESRLAFQMRLHDAKEQLETLPEDATVVVVSHSIFINFFVEHICNELLLPFWKAALMLLKVRSLDNSSITQLRYDPTLPSGTCKWSVVAYDMDEHVVS